jgi:branched-chain amino acid transport system ATP-binding protein
MLAIGQALASRPRLLMIDEPSAGLAPVIVRDVMRTVAELRADGLGILLVEQLVDQALRIADEVVVLDNGRVVLAGAAERMRGTDELRNVYLGIGPAPAGGGSGPAPAGGGIGPAPDAAVSQKGTQT